MDKKNLIYIGVPGSAVFQSQVVGLLRSIEHQNYFDNIYLLLGVKDNKENAVTNEKLVNSRINVLYFRLLPNYSLFKRRQVKELKGILTSLIRGNTVIHIRGEALSESVMLNINNISHYRVKILSDIRGASFEEAKIYNSYGFLLDLFKRSQLRKNIRDIHKNSHYVSCVSSTLKLYLLERSLVSKRNIFVNHCVAGSTFNFSKITRDIYRKKMKLKDDDILLVFLTGGDKKWQNTYEIINKIVSRGYKVLNLSKREIDLPNVINLFVPLEEVPNYLNAADIGVIWRNNDIVNNVACPVKFSEYACCGLPVLSNKGVTLIKNYIEDTGFGKIINSLNNLQSKDIDYLMSMDRHLIAKNAHLKFSSEIVSKDYISIYDKMLLEKNSVS